LLTAQVGVGYTLQMEFYMQWVLDSLIIMFFNAALDAMLRPSIRQSYFHRQFLVKKGFAVASNGVMKIKDLGTDKVEYEYSHNFPCAT